MQFSVAGGVVLGRACGEHSVAAYRRNSELIELRSKPRSKVTSAPT